MEAWRRCKAFSCTRIPSRKKKILGIYTIRNNAQWWILTRNAFTAVYYVVASFQALMYLNYIKCHNFRVKSPFFLKIGNVLFFLWTALTYVFIHFSLYRIWSAVSLSDTGQMVIDEKHQCLSCELECFCYLFQIGSPMGLTRGRWQHQRYCFKQESFIVPTNHTKNS